MSLEDPFTDLKIETQSSGFYKGYSLPIALVSKLSVSLLVLWALVWPFAANDTLRSWKSGLLSEFNTFYDVSVGLFAFFLLLIALIPATGRMRLGAEDERPEFSNFSWFSMMFGAGLGVGLMVYATAEPLGLWETNPLTVSGEVAPKSEEAIEGAYRYTFLHTGFHAWAIYVVTGLSLAYYAYTRDMPLTIRAALTPLLGEYANGVAGHVIDILGVVATILGVAVTIGYGVSQLVDGAFLITGMQWLVDGAQATANPSTAGLIAALALVMMMSTLSAVSGVGRGVKYLSNINLVLSLVLLAVFIAFGSFSFAMTTYAAALVDYIANFIPLSFQAYSPMSQADFASVLPAEAAPFVGELFTGATDAWGTKETFLDALSADAAGLSDQTKAAAYEAGTQGRLFEWQAGWTTFYWAWWIAFSPFVGLFLARISKGRTVREFIIGAVVAPSLVCFAWMTILGGSAIDLELNGGANGAILAASTTATLFVTLGEMISGHFLTIISIMCVLLTMTFLVTSADSGILVMNTIMSGGSEDTGLLHRIIWGVLLTLVIGTLLIAGGGGLEALTNSMIIGALPFSVVLLLMCVSLAKAMINDLRRSSNEEHPDMSN
ncbi:BCCT family transporter [Ruegeria sp. 2205SS24-7]|uniref:BCCT family transporter n=1 Tax=Ruegeria discodermiae TaxID=3064389 RepID=UPI00274056C9|nr:BCCT family transporter [Ruegeria sp. 2205SS24-7]MDP5217327.1 BCCT family transporter [Ruegeria sp. 2205SS24-7]